MGNVSLILAVGTAVIFYIHAGAGEDDNIMQVTGRRVARGSVGSSILHKERQFKVFMEKYGKQYLTKKEYLRRLQIFTQNMAKAVVNQALDPTAIHGITPFSDLSDEEFEKQLTGLRPTSFWGRLPESQPLMEIARPPKNFDWRAKGAVTEVKFQGPCGSCWAFSTTGVIEGAHFVATGKLLNLSEQQLVDCDNTCDAEEADACNNGCSGGLMTNAYKYLMQVGGLEEESSYPYTGAQGECKYRADKAVVGVANFTKIPLDENQILANLVYRGPLAVGLNAVFMQTYVGGVSCPLICPRKYVNHGVLLVGYGADGFSILRLGNRPFWIVKNSWGRHWGENGYYRLCRGHDMCGINTMVSAVVTASP